MAVPSDMILKHRSRDDYRLSDATEPIAVPVQSSKRKTTKFQDSLIEIAHIDNDSRMSYMHAALYSSVLEDAITEFRILDECNNELRLIKTRLGYSNMVSEKYGISKSGAADDHSELDQNNLNRDVYTVNMLDKNRKFILKVLTDTYLNMSTKRSFDRLSKAVEEILAQNNYLCTLEQEEAKNKQLHRELARQLRHQRNHNMSSNYDIDAVIDKIRSQVEDVALLAEIRSRYVTNWQVARTEQHKLKINETESIRANDIELFKDQLDREQRVHYEIETIVSFLTNDTLAKIEEWMNKFDQDMEAIDLKIQIMKCNYDSENDKRLDLEKLYAKHKEQIHAWYEYKASLEKIRLYNIKMNKSAIIVQAWWRGILVRFQLGPYKPRRRRRGGKKKSLMAL